MSAITVFISYSHDSDEHRKQVLALSERLREDGIETLLDQYLSKSVAQNLNTECTCGAQCASNGIPVHFVFPKADYRPAIRLEPASVPEITLVVRSSLLGPVLQVGLGCATVRAVWT